MDIQSVLKHMSLYWEVYQYVAENGAGSLEDIKSYLIEQCHKPESTARGNISAIKDSPNNEEFKLISNAKWTPLSECPFLLCESFS